MINSLNTMYVKVLEVELTDGRMSMVLTDGRMSMVLTGTNILQELQTRDRSNIRTFPLQKSYSLFTFRSGFSFSLLV